MPPVEPVALPTPRLLLRPYEAADAADFYAVLDRSRERLAYSFPDRLRAVATPADTPGQLAAFAHDWRTGRFYVFGIWQRATGQYLGDICLMPQRGGQAEIGYYLDAAAEGQGYGREALAAVVDFGFGPVGATRLLIRCFADNLRGQAVARSQGFVLEATVAGPADSAWPWLRRAFRPAASVRPDILYFVRRAHSFPEPGARRATPAQ